MPRPRIPLISRDSAVETALRIIEAEGYQNFSVEKVARAMGVKSPSLYHHFVNRTGLLNEVARALLEGVPMEPDPDTDVTDWQEWFVALSVNTYDLIMRHPRAAALLFTHFPTSMVLPAHERGARILAIVGVEPKDRWVVMRGLEKLVFGLAAADADDLVQHRDHLPVHVDRAALPYVVEAVAAGEQDRRALVERAIRLYLAGVTTAMLPPD
jgi:TetR/AcrR family transcriptional regulator, tetracycline repressor protein